MLPSTGYFKALNCPFFEMGFCERPYCHFKHIKKDATPGETAVPVPEPPQKIQGSTSTKDTTETPPVVAAPVPDLVVKQEPGVSQLSPSPVVGAGVPPTNLGIESTGPDATPGPSSIPGGSETAVIPGGPGPAISNSLLLAAGGQASLEQLVQDAVKKVLLGAVAGGEGAAGLLKAVDPAAILSQIVQVKKEKAEEDSDSDCVIEEVVPAPISQPPVARVKTEQRPLDLPLPPGETKPTLYLPPADCPVYNPTPIKDLQRRENEKITANIPQVLVEATAQANKSSPTVKIRNAKQKFSYKPQDTSSSKEGGILGDLDDLSESEEEKGDTPDVLGDILKEGNKTGVLTGGVVSEFEERVIKERLKLFRKRSDKSDQCDKISSSSPTHDEVNKSVEGVIPEVLEETEEAKSERKLKEKEEEIRKLEEKRLLLENYYKAKCKEKKERELLKEGDKKKSESNLKSKDVKIPEEKKRRKTNEDVPRKPSKDSKRRSHHKSRKDEKRKRKYSTETDTDSGDSSDDESSSDSESSDDSDNGKSKRRTKKHSHSRRRSNSKQNKHNQRKHKKESKRRKDKSEKDKSKKASKKRHRDDSSSVEDVESERESSRKKRKKEKYKKRKDHDKRVVNIDEDDLNTENDKRVVNMDEGDLNTEDIELAVTTDSTEVGSLNVKREPGSEPVADESIIEPSPFLSAPTGEISDNFFRLCGVEPESTKDDSEKSKAGGVTLKIRDFSELLEKDPQALSDDLPHGESNVANVTTNETVLKEESVVEGLYKNDEANEYFNEKQEDFIVPNEPGLSFSSALGEPEGTIKHKHAKSKKEDGKAEKDKDKRSSSSKKSSSSSHKSDSSSHKSRTRSPHHSSRSSSHKSSKSSHHSSSSSRHKSSKSSSSSRHKSNSSKDKSDDQKSSSSKDRDGRKSSSSKDRSDAQKSSFSSKDRSDSQKSRKEEKVLLGYCHVDSNESREDSKSPIPDLSEELAMLPDISSEIEDIGETYDMVADGLEDMFDGVDDAGDDELQKIFADYEAETPEEVVTDASLRKAKQLEERLKVAAMKSGADAGQAVGKKRVAYQGAEDQTKEKRPLHHKKPAVKTPAQAMYDRYKKIQAMRQQQLIEQRLTDITAGDESHEESSPLTSQAGPSSSIPESESGGRKARVAHKVGPNPPPILGKTKKQLAARHQAGASWQASSSSAGTSAAGKVDEKTAAVTNTKGTSRKAHTPSSATVAKVASRPMVTPDPHSKVPTNIRQRYLNSIIDECIKIYGGDQLEAWGRAEKEEQDCCRKASSRMIYLNLVVNCIKKLRAEAVLAAKRGVKVDTSPVDKKRSMLTTHMQVLAGKAGSIGTWSIEKPKTTLNTEDIDETLLFKVMEKYILTEEQLVDNGFPRAYPADPGKAVTKIEPRRKEDPEKARQVANCEDKRLCARCATIYRVDKEGLQVEKEDCVHHWGRLFRRRGNRATGPASQWYCCDGTAESDGCQVSKVHVTDTLDFNNMRGFVSTLDKDGPGRVFALDCEMCNTTKGNELTRVTVLDYTGETCYESLVMPDTQIVDYNTRFSGITAEDMVGVTTTLREVQAHLLLKFEAKDILIGHSLESDLKALKLLHGTVVDTSVVFPHKMGPPFKRALKFLTQEHLRRIIQSCESGHDSKEDALACLDLMKMKVTEDVKIMSRGSAGQMSKRRDAFLTDPDKVSLT